MVSHRLVDEVSFLPTATHVLWLSLAILLAFSCLTANGAKRLTVLLANGELFALTDGFVVLWTIFMLRY